MREECRADWTPRAPAMRPAPPSTEKLEAVPESDHVPPVSAAPNPFDTVRLNVSDASTPFGGGSVDELTVTERLVVPVSTAVVGDGERDRVGAGGRVGVLRRDAGAGGAVTEVPRCTTAIVPSSSLEALASNEARQGSASRT